MALGDDLSTAWSRPDATAETRKAILRAVLEEIVVTLADGCVDLLLHWRGGDHTRLSVPRNRRGQHRWAASAEVVDLVRGLARQLPDGAIAATLNRLGKKTGRGNSWTEARVRTFRNSRGVAVFRSGEMAERGELTLTRCRRTARHQQDDGAAVDCGRHNRRHAGVQGRAMGHPGGADRRPVRH